MPRKQHTSTHREFTPDEDALFEQAKREDDAELDQLKAQARAMVDREGGTLIKPEAA